MKVLTVIACASVMSEFVLDYIILPLSCCFIKRGLMFLHSNLPLKVAVNINIMRFKTILLYDTECYIELSV